jgi:hypothetical protein
VTRLRDHTSTRRFRDLLDDAQSLGRADAHAVVKVLGNGIEAHRSVATALYAFLRHHDSFQESELGVCKHLCFRDGNETTHAGELVQSRQVRVDAA